MELTWHLCDKNIFILWYFATQKHINYVLCKVDEIWHLFSSITHYCLVKSAWEDLERSFCDQQPSGVKTAIVLHLLWFFQNILESRPLVSQHDHLQLTKLGRWLLILENLNCYTIVLLEAPESLLSSSALEKATFNSLLQNDAKLQNDWFMANNIWLFYSSDSAIKKCQSY